MPHRVSNNKKRVPLIARLNKFAHYIDNVGVPRTFFIVKQLTLPSSPALWCICTDNTVYIRHLFALNTLDMFFIPTISHRFSKRSLKSRPKTTCPKNIGRACSSIPAPFCMCDFLVKKCFDWHIIQSVGKLMWIFRFFLCLTTHM